MVGFAVGCEVRGTLVLEGTGTFEESDPELSFIGAVVGLMVGSVGITTTPGGGGGRDAGVGPDVGTVGRAGEFDESAGWTIGGTGFGGLGGAGVG